MGAGTPVNRAGRRADSALALPLPKTRTQSLNFDRYQVLRSLPTQDARHPAFSLAKLLHSIECELG